MHRTISHSDYLSGAAIHGELTIPQQLENSRFYGQSGRSAGVWVVFIPVPKESNRTSILGQVRTNVHSNKIFI